MIVLTIPYKIVFLVQLGLWLFYFQLRILHRQGIQLSKIFKLQTPTLELIRNYFRKVTTTTIISVTCYCISIIGHSPTDTDISALDFVPLVNIFAIFLVFCWENSRLDSTMSRVLLGRIDHSTRFTDILVSDTLTSYSKELIDLGTYICNLIHLHSSCHLTQTCERGCGGTIHMDLLLGLYPSIIRLSQCIREFFHDGKRVHLFNALKYSTNLPVFVCNVMKRRGSAPPVILFQIINSAYSLFWDVKMDWKLQAGMRPRMYKFVLWYYLAVFNDTVLRFIWVPATCFGYTFHEEPEMQLFVLQLLEIFRRWCWLFIKLEVEHVNSSNAEDLPKFKSDKGSKE